MPKRRLFAALLTLIVAAAPALAGEWPMFRHDARRSAVTDEKLALPLALKWRYRAPQPPAPAWPEPVKNLNRTDFDYAFHPVAAGGSVYFASSADDTLRALDAETGKVRWAFTAGGPLRFAPQVVGGRVYVGGDDGFVYCLDTSTGTPVWSFRGGPGDEMILGNGRAISRWPIRTGVLVDKGVLYFVAGMWPAEGIFIWALDAATGKPIWCNDTSGHIPTRVVGHSVDESLAGICPQGPLLASDDRLVVPMGRAAPATFDRATGKLLRFDPGDANGLGGSFLTIDNDKCYAFSNNFYSPVALSALSLDTLARSPATLRQVQMPALAPPVAATFLKGRQYSVFDQRLVAIVNDSTMTTRAAEGIARSGGMLVVGYDGAVAIEDSVAKRAAAVRLAVAGDQLAMLVDVSDSRVTRDAEKPWKGSCFEVFVAATPGAPIAQVMVVPGGEDGPALLLAAKPEKPAPIDGARVETPRIPGGYQVRATIPLSALGIDPAAKSLRMEFQITTVTNAGKQNRATMFGSVLAYQNRDKYADFSVGDRAAADPSRRLALTPPVERLDQLPAALAKSPTLPMGVSDQAESWRAAVTGKAHGIAVADGKLIVSTDAGEISCFASSSGDGAAPAMIDELPLPAAASVLGDAEKSLAARVTEAGMDHGYAVVTGDADGKIARALTALPELHVLVTAPTPAETEAMRKKLLTTTRLYGTRIHVVLAPADRPLPFPRYIASAVVVASPANLPNAGELFRVLRPAGGVMLFPGLDGAARAQMAEAVKKSAGEQVSGDASALARARLPGAWDWDSTGVGDKLVRWPLRPIWFGGTEPARTHNRKFQGPTLTAANGLFIENADAWITAVDAYNGARWWSRPKPLQTREGLPYGSSIAADDKSVYVVLSQQAWRGRSRGCIELDARTGRQRRIYAAWNPPPIVDLASPRSWPMTVTPPPTATAPGNAAPATPIGSATLERDERGMTLRLACDRAKAPRRTAWLLCLDFRPIDQRFGFFDPGVWAYRILPGDAEGTPATWQPANGESHPPIQLAPGAPGKPGVTVRLNWADVPALAGKMPGSVGFALQLTQLMPDVEQQPIVADLFSDEFSNGINNGWANLVLDPAAAEAAKKRPAIVAGRMEGEEGANDEPSPPLPKSKWTPRGPSIDRATPMWRIHPLTGQRVERTWTRGDGCGGSAYSASAVIARAANAGIYDFFDDSGLRTFPGVRASCGNSMVAALGVWYMANGGTGCECTYSFLSQVALAPADRRLNEDWAVFSEWKADTMVKTATINLGAPGDRRDDAGTLWLAFPRPPRGYVASVFSPTGANSPPSGVWIGNKGDAATPLPIEVTGFGDAGPARLNTDRVPIAGTDKPWLYGSNFTGIKSVKISLDPRRALKAIESTGAVQIDGRLDDAAWKNPPAVELPTTQSTVWFAYSATHLYVACRRPTAVDRRGAPRAWNTTPSQVFHFGDTWDVFLSDASNKNVIHLATTAGRQRLMGLALGMTPEKPDKFAGAEIASNADDAGGFVAEFSVPLALLAEKGIDVHSLAVNARIGDHPIVGEAMVRLGEMSTTRCQGFVPLDLAQPAGASTRTFSLKLHFAELSDTPAGARVFDVKVNGKTVASKIDVASEAGGPRRALVREVGPVTAGEQMLIEFVPAATNVTPENAPILSAIELRETSGDAAAK